MPQANRKEVLIEKWLPIAELGAESQRERAASSALPPLYFLHVWWARRPLIVCRAAILASLLPADTDRSWFLKALGIFGDPVGAKKLIDKAKKTGERLATTYGYNRAFTYFPEDGLLSEISGYIVSEHGLREIVVLDPMAGGGSIPFEAVRYGFSTYANELNPVAYGILKATFDYPARFGKALSDAIKKWSDEVLKQTRERLKDLYPKKREESIYSYIWARTIACRDCGLSVPLSPNWWLRKETGREVAARFIIPKNGDTGKFQISRGGEIKDYNPSNGTVSKGTGKCPRCSAALDGDYIKAEAQAGRMGHQLYALAVKTQAGRDFRTPEKFDLDAIERAEEGLKESIIKLRAANLLPDEDIPEGHKTDEAIRYGFKKWKDLFSPRQLLGHLTYLDSIRRVKADIFRDEPPDRARAIITYLALIFDKCCDHNSRMSRWESTRTVIKGTFDRHDFSFKWSYAEFDHSDMLWPWATDQVIDAYSGLCDLISPSQAEMFKKSGGPPVRIDMKNAAALDSIPPGSAHLICIDPPYYDNVMYAELSDFFYVWQKRVLGDVYPEAFTSELTDKDSEAVANPARFRGLKGARVLADKDYEVKMRACFSKMHQLLRPDGVMTVMFTHKRVDAWDTLAAALIEAGFEITASWPVHTESEHSLHQAKKNAAASTILLVCRKREKGKGDGSWWDDIAHEVANAARSKAQEFESLGIGGVDLYISSFGPALQVISSRWPVRDRNNEPLRPDRALDEARRAVTDYRYEKLLKKHSASLPVDPQTKWAIMAWDIYKAARFPYDEARKLALSIGVDIDGELKRRHIVAKEGSDVVLLSPERRRRRGLVDPGADFFDWKLDAIHTACVVYVDDGAGGTRRFLDRTGLLRDESFAAAVEALLHALPPAIIHPAVHEKDRRGEWYLREIAINFMRGWVEVPEVEQFGLFPEEKEDEAEEDSEED